MEYTHPNQLFQNHYTQEKPEYNFYSIDLNQPTIFDVSGLNKVSSNSSSIPPWVDPGGDPEPHHKKISVGDGLHFILILALIYIIKLWTKNQKLKMEMK